MYKKVKNNLLKTKNFTNVKIFDKNKIYKPF